MTAPHASSYLVTASGAAICAIGGYVSMAFAPAWYAPASMATVLPTLVLASIHSSQPLGQNYYSLVPGLALHLVFSLPLLLLRRQSQRQWVITIFCVIAAANVVWIVANLQHGLIHQGLGYVASVVTINAFWMGLLAYFVFTPKQNSTSPLRPIINLSLIMLCTVWVAFPWLGEAL